jgi:hypothetical protein
MSNLMRNLGGNLRKNLAIGKYPASTNTLSGFSTTVEYERIAADVTRTTAFYFSRPACHKYSAQGRWSRCARNSSMDANRIMPSGIWASIEPSEYSE